MKVTWMPPSAFDAEYSHDNGATAIRPNFYSRKSAAPLALLLVQNDAGQTLGQYLLTVSGDGRVLLRQRSETVVPEADAEDGKEAQP